MVRLPDAGRDITVAICPGVRQGGFGYCFVKLLAASSQEPERAATERNSVASVCVVSDSTAQRDATGRNCVLRTWRPGSGCAARVEYAIMDAGYDPCTSRRAFLAKHSDWLLIALPPDVIAPTSVSQRLVNNASRSATSRLHTLLSFQVCGQTLWRLCANTVISRNVNLVVSEYETKRTF